MKILFVSLFLPEEKASHAGGRFVFEIIRKLSVRHEIHLSTRLESGEVAGLEALKPFCREIYPFPYPSLERRTLAAKAGLAANYLRFSRHANRLIREIEPDLVMVEWVEAAILFRRSKTPMILDAHDVITKPASRRLAQSSGFARFPAFFAHSLIRAMERRINHLSTLTFTRSAIDRDFLLAMEPRLDVCVVPHPAGLDVTRREYVSRPGTILFLASYKHRRVNVEAALWFYHRVFPRVREGVPDARFIIAGYGPPEQLTSLQKVDPQVQVTGFVEDLDRCYKEAAVFVAPILTGGGIIVKILDALAAGRPVVTTSYGNEGIAAEPGRDLLVADDPEAFAAHVVRFLTDPEFAENIAENGRSLVRKNYGLEAVIERIEEAYGRIVGGTASRPEERHG